MMMSTCETYNSEIAPPKLRGPLLSIFQFFLLLGQLIAVAVAESQTSVDLQQISYRVCFATQYALAGFAFIAALFVSGSPAYRLWRGKVEAARKSFARLHNESSAEGSIVAMQSLFQQQNQIKSANRGAT